MEDLLIADIGTVSVKERHAQNMFKEAKKRRKLTWTNYTCFKKLVKAHKKVGRIWQSN